MPAPTPTVTTMLAPSSKGDEGRGQDTPTSQPLGMLFITSFFALLKDYLLLDYIYRTETMTTMHWVFGVGTVCVDRFDKHL